MKTITTKELSEMIDKHVAYREYLRCVRINQSRDEYLIPKDQGKQLNLEDIDFDASVRSGVLDYITYKNCLSVLDYAIITRCKFHYSGKGEGLEWSSMSLSYSVITDCDFSHIRLHYTDIEHSTLSGCNFTGTTFREVGFRNVTITNCNFTDARFEGCDFRSMKISGNIIDPSIEKVPDIVEKVRKTIASASGEIDMRGWHTCKTVHCLAGWIVHLHPKGYNIEANHDCPSAATLILMAANHPSVPNYFDTAKGANLRAMNWLATGKQEDPSVV